MKEGDVPQDAGKLGGLKELTYVVSDGGAYTTAQSAGWSAKNVANDLAWEEIRRQVEAACREVRAGRRSPLAYHMARFQMTEGMLAEFTGFSRRRVRRHLEPDGWRALTPEEARRYAETFEIGEDELCRTP